ncbi:hypothetical protein [Streptomyces sp. NPDC001389]|uniref:hypothetical protein n=1 Tax=Streptomyces sp. NPDC001389 TaxID=3364569 RepID=UPI000A821851
MTDKAKPKGTCPVCDRPFTLTKDGTLRHHLMPRRIGRQFSPECDGTGQPPRTA